MSPPKGVNIPTPVVFTKDNNLVVEAHLPNFEQKDVNIEVENGALVISAERHEKEEDKGKHKLFAKAPVAYRHPPLWGVLMPIRLKHTWMMAY